MSYPADPLEPELLALERELSGLRPIQPDFPLSQKITRAMDRMDPVLAILDGIGPIPPQVESSNRLLRWKKPVATAARRAGPLAAAAGFGLLGTVVYHKAIAPASRDTGTTLADTEPTKRGTVTYDPTKGPYGQVSVRPSRFDTVGAGGAAASPSLLERAIPAHPRSGWLGVVVAELEPQVKESLPTKSGVVVLAVAQFSPAQQNSLAVGDVILTANGKPMNEVHDLMNACQSTPPGNNITLRVSSSGRVFDVTPKLIAAPPSA